MKITTAAVVAVTLAASITAVSNADILANWTFEVNTPPDLANSAVSPLSAADAGIFAATSIASGVHVSALTDWTTPSGNGSANSLSSNEWAVGDYYQFTTSTVGYEDISIAWDQTGSNTGPRDFQLAYSTDGVIFTDFGAGYALINGSWGAVPVVTTSYSQNLAAIAALDNQGTIWFRMRVTSTIAINGTTTASGGTGRVDNIVINGTAIPAPGALALLGLAGLVGSRRRRR